MTDMDAAAGQRARLEQRRRHAEALAETLGRERAALVEASEASNADDEHDPEGATIAFERAQLDATIADVRRQLADLTAALARVDAGTYGICVICGLPIPAERLEARPSATTHVACAP
ncbi:TraR/DksA C4-type zinc finger protein [Salinibacterium sp. G-O1]|uniref:TraR/DksA family transcriptional regulator n=1 Tax=Salinibacterium sp. G-O1 TaxID=3046208 RepID=UPI0024B94BBB|nr:TraR/DksA C4-type zinc finger protein [Salinibacterium sp. G-O1]MDJ0333911.1 TraR/DksA C4-type zinc finger protein [Salinibacterium sp. G-O1]